MLSGAKRQKAARFLASSESRSVCRFGTLWEPSDRMTTPECVSPVGIAVVDGEAVGQGQFRCRAPSVGCNVGLIKRLLSERDTPGLIQE